MSPKDIIDTMFNNDPFSQWLGIERLKEGPGFCVLRMHVREEMMNGFAIAHGGICYALADSALAFSSNAHGRKCVSVETSISHVQPVRAGDVLTTEVEEVSLNHKIGIYNIRIVNQYDVDVALFKGSVYRKSESWGGEQPERSTHD
jgi:acyl-CoA thioesterase